MLCFLRTYALGLNLHSIKDIRIQLQSMFRKMMALKNRINAPQMIFWRGLSKILYVLLRAQQFIDWNQKICCGSERLGTNRDGRKRDRSKETDYQQHDESCVISWNYSKLTSCTKLYLHLFEEFNKFLMVLIRKNFFKIRKIEIQTTKIVF